MNTQMYPKDKNRFLLILWIVLMPLAASLQPVIDSVDTLSQKQFIQGCALYRHHFIDNITKVLLEFGELCDSLKAVSAHPEAHDEFRDLFLQDVLASEFQDLGMLMARDFPDSFQDEKDARKTYRAWIDKNNIQLFQFNFLLANDIIAPVQPYRLTSLNDFWQEIRMYELKANQAFVDVGAGIGVVSFILAGTGLPLHIQMTEIDEHFLDFLNQQARDSTYVNKSGQLKVSTAHKKDLGLAPDVKVDRILMREVFHHLKHPDEMLASVKSHLNEEGMLILVESVKELNIHNKSRCYKAMELDKILSILNANGFDLKQKKRIGNAYVLQLVAA